MAYNPDEPRDEHGRWTQGSGGSHTSPGRPDVHVTDQSNAEAGKMVSERAAAVAKALDYPVEKMFVSDKDHGFELNGTQRTAAGMYWHNSESIELVAHKLTFVMPASPDGGVPAKVMPNGIAGVVAHEIMHAKYDALTKDYRRERDAMEKDPDYRKENSVKWVPFDANNPEHVASKERGEMITTDGQVRERTKGFMNPDGSLNEPYASRYPLYQKYNDATGGTRKGNSIEDFAKTDGVSQYSKDYWTDWANGKTSTDHALHETLAEIARLRYEHSVKYDPKATKEEHEARVRELKSMGAEWTAEHEAEWRKNSRLSIGFMRYKQGEVDGKKVYFATTKGSPDRISHAWSELYNLVDWNWKRRNKK